MKEFLQNIPLIGPIFECGMQEHKHSLVEIMSNIFWSTMPIWLGGIIVWITGTPIYDAFKSTIKGGELFIYSTSLLAPIFYMALYDKPGFGVFPSKMSHMILVALVLIISAVIFGLGRTGTQMDSDLVFDISIWTFCSSVILIYLATLYHGNRMPSPSEEMKKGESDFSDAYFEHRG